MTDWSPDVGRLQALDDAEWRAVERAYCGRLAAYVARRVADRQAREDVVQEAFLGAVRGIGDFDRAYTFEQYLFGIAKNRTIDHLRRQRPLTLASHDPDGPGGDSARPLVEDLAADRETPSAIVRGQDLAHAAGDLLRAILRDWVQETWAEEEFTRLMVIEALFSGGWRNRDTWKRFGLRDETSAAGIKFRALRRLREMARERDPGGTLLPQLALALDEGGAASEVLVGDAWRKGRASCPARHWLARSIAGALPEGPAACVRFHLEEMRCEWCQANHDDLLRQESETALQPLLDRLEASTAQYLRSRTIR